MPEVGVKFYPLRFRAAFDGDASEPVVPLVVRGANDGVEIPTGQFGLKIFARALLTGGGNGNLRRELHITDKGIAHVAIDSDNENSTLKRFHPETRFLDLSKRRALDGIFAALETINLVVMDCRAASTDLFIEFFAEIDLFAVLSVLGAKLTLVMPVNHESDSVEQIQRLTDEFADKCNYVVVRNAAHSDSFTIFETCEVRALLKDKLGAREIGMSRIQDWLVEALNAENLTITTAAKHPAFSLLDRQRLQTWQRRFYAEVESASNLLLPSK